MASTPNFFFFSGLLFLARITADVHSVKVLPDVLKGSRVVLRPVESVTSITTITWKHGDNLAVEWLGEKLTFYNIFEDTCSLNTTTGELTINNVRPEHSGVYTPDINLRTRSAMKLQVLSPVPKPSISHDCYPGETPTCTLRCMHTCTLDNVGHVEVSWIVDDRHREKGPELQITKDTKTKTFICSLKNPVSSENSTKLLNPLLPGDTGVPWWILVIGTLASIVSIGLLAFVCWKWIYLKYRRDWMIKEIRETKMFEEHDRITDELHAAGLVTDVEITLLDADGVILRILREGNKRKLSEDNIEHLLTARYVILWTLQQGPEVQKSLENVQKLRKKFFSGTKELQLPADKELTLQAVNQMIWGIFKRTKELQLSEEEEITLQDAHWRILRILVEKKKPEVTEDELSRLNEEDQKLKDVEEGIEWILSKKEDLKLSEEEKQTLLHVHLRISIMIFNLKERRVDEDVEITLVDVDKMISRILNMKKELKLSYEEKQTLLHVQRTLSTVIIKKEDEEKERRRLNGASNDTSRSRDPAAERLISSAGPEAEDPV